MLNLFFVAWFVMSLVHLWDIRARRKRGVILYSRYSGAPHPFWYKLSLVWKRCFGEELGEIDIKLWLEPIASFGIAWLVFHPISPLLCLWVSFAAFCMHFTVQIEMNRARHYLLDILDSQLEVEHIQKAVQGTATAQETHGFSMPGCADLANQVDFDQLRARLNAARLSTASETPGEPDPGEASPDETEPAPPLRPTAVPSLIQPRRPRGRPRRQEAV